MNVELLQRVKQHILDNPKRLRMNNWLINDNSGDFANIKGDTFVFDCEGWHEPRTQPIPDCGAVACMAGWTVIIGDNLDPKTADIPNASDRARDLLGITEAQTAELFWVDGWDDEDEDAYLAAESADERARIVGEVIDGFIERYAAK